MSRSFSVRMEIVRFGIQVIEVLVMQRQWGHARNYIAAVRGELVGAERLVRRGRR